ncbi:hypothetical protein CDEF62S_02723 [Castellaniella defragrans]
MKKPLWIRSRDPSGAYGVPLQPQRAIAVDTRFVPLGTPVYLDTQRPGGGEALRRLVYALDTGAAIQGAGRAYFYRAPETRRAPWPAA